MNDGAPPYLTVRSVDIRYGSVAVVSGVSFDVRKGEFVTLVGPSGSGKTSLLNAIAGFVEPAAGDIVVDGERINAVPAFRRNIGMVFQNYALFPHLTIEQNISFGLRRRRVAPAEIAKRLAEVLDIVGLADFEARLPSELSGGQQQRVAIARAIAFQPHLLLLDEPMSNLDAQLRVSMRAELVAIVARIGITAICVTHDQTEALSISDRIVVLARGRVQQIGSPHEVYNRPANEFVAKFIGQSNLLRYRVTEGAAEGTPTGLGPAGLCPLPDASPGGGEAVLFLLRPEDIRMAPPGCGPAGHPARVVHADYMGSFSLYRIAVGAEELLVQQSTIGGGSVFRAGDPVVVSWDPVALVRIGA